MPKGAGHTRHECPNSKKGKGVPLQSSDYSESEEDGKVMKNMVAFGARKEKSSESSDSDVSTDSEDYQVMHNKWLNLKNENLRLQHDLVQSREQYKDLAEELAAVSEKNESLEKEVSKLREVAIDERERAMMLDRDLAENRKQIRMLNSGSKDLDKILSMGQPAKANWGLGYRRAESTGVQQKGLSHFMHGSTSKNGAKGTCQEVRRDVRQGVRQEVIQHAAVSNKPKVVHQCNNMMVRHEVLKHSFAAGTRKETDRASATVSGQARSNIGCVVGYVGRLDTRRWSVLLVRRAETWPRRKRRQKKDAALLRVILRLIKKNQVWSQDTRLFVAQRGRRSKCVRKWCEMIFRGVIVKSLQDNSNECRGHSVWMGKGSWSRRRHMTEARFSTEVGRRVVRQVRQVVMQYLLFRCSRGCVMIIQEERDSGSVRLDI
ncbi:hypothetical protein F2Q70_00017936 [Brassica cretica]|uniref:Uncharacterized protein n=1 Tax=Brassica cretica TaxID=69181 RepID=A0A8S9HT95_BRACR|nr:hypothetical protein F2Q70_00017936 [Brassica cretica]